MAGKRYQRREDVSETDVDGEIFLVEPGSQDVFYLDLVGAGLVLSQVDVKKQGRYGYSYGYGSNNAYYFDNSKYFSD